MINKLLSFIIVFILLKINVKNTQLKEINDSSIHIEELENKIQTLQNLVENLQKQAEVWKIYLLNEIFWKFSHNNCL